MTTQDMLDDRYGRRRSPGRTWAIIGGAVVGVALLGFVAWGVVADSVEAVDADTTGFAVVDQHSVTVNFQFTAPTGRSVACAIEAQDVEHGVVGWKVVEFAASEDHARAFRETIPTTAEATTGFVNACWVT
ncbi:hypothetical protein JOD63_000872 [Microbacterium terrae]|uniref:Uncharacterized protein n=1 Tax=Microbacterium terrae TaxID=69369 RepID=A0A0M2H5Z8_9MICO|nr:DUF4307 domain-containing protein [Microbacterium terrae]KJL39965.1 hypothetical protein RS81_01785 [Microbacterium terrae]MBP1076904.1 hypothetical protein [Microbacterium terrae]GLJ99499.1 hypothetical protein GCM10017594_26970 [Microbacterium terrae]